ncbi:MAG: AbrB/MazE/SpoVT family DNA-binding domain-containing protein [Caldilineaceae bacterium]|nr:AbrB/MazE/SpoVT family DNA-binding domain-containing protein [Caldilineaceae bacterium]MBP8107208.1 AbrB/MazE/SpoVT family DNA-binding domain-containing protein [Caldilineaceae bacterium]MBP8122243.1 AbrB/MazE/SpoVT family DNA-binding domain-containing protein [Caldilineaceae bacterium]MBP9072814.1 AbrB/MazE/SpoVT family DNA-binding domain-containing protein [Caldilineaceae bacterium]
MSEMITLQLAQRGILTLPKALRDQYNLQPGEIFTLLDLDGVFVLMPGRSKIDYLSDRVRSVLEDQGETLESMLVALREARETYDASA